MCLFNIAVNGEYLVGRFSLTKSESLVYPYLLTTATSVISIISLFLSVSLSLCLSVSLCLSLSLSLSLWCIRKYPMTCSYGNKFINQYFPDALIIVVASLKGRHRHNSYFLKIVNTVILLCFDSILACFDSYIRERKIPINQTVPLGRCLCTTM